MGIKNTVRIDIVLFFDGAATNTYLNDTWGNFFAPGHNTGMIVRRTFVFVPHIRMSIQLQDRKCIVVFGYGLESTDTDRVFPTQ